jgi:putative inorganic carbon (hco3(-)) transporter
MPATPGNGQTSWRARFTFDKTLTATIIFLLVGSPFAFGAVHQWAYTAVEIVILSLVAAWLVFSLTSLGGIERKCSYHCVGGLVAAAASFLTVVGLQLVPMPMWMLRVVSPEAYALYSKAFNGPEDSAPRDSSSGSARATTGEFAIAVVHTAGAKNASTTRASVSGTDAMAGGLASSQELWRPTSIAPTLTASALVEAVAYTGLFFMVITYRFDLGVAGEIRFVRAIVVTLTICGALLALTGIAEQAYWNGKILWFFVPDDWGAPRYASFPRASGPFVDPDHFANYLGMIFPLAAGCTLFGLPGDRPSQRADRWVAMRLWFGIASLIVLLAIVLSFSRAIWVLTGFGILAFCSFGPYLLRASRSHSRPRSSTSGSLLKAMGRKTLRGIGASFIVSLLLLLLMGVFLGTGRDNSVVLRLGQTIGDRSFGIGVRPALWNASSRMFEEHLLTGVGLGTWAEIFPHYESPPRLEMAFRQAHNDYLQLAAEVGMLGLIPLGWVILCLGYVGVRIGSVSYDKLPFLLSLGIAIAVMLLHELVDFAMHIPANALLFTILLALALRVISQPNVCPEQRGTPVDWFYLIPQVALVSGVYILLVSVASGKTNLGYPADLRQSNKLTTAMEVISQHPASASAYMDRFAASGAANWPAADVDDLDTAVWLDPTNPYDRDLYAAALEEKGDVRESLQQLTRSLYNAPNLSSHFYLQSGLIKRLRGDQIEAVEEGLAQAVAAREPGAVPTLAQIREMLGDFNGEAKLYESAATNSGPGDPRSQYYDLAGRAWIKADRASYAVNDFRQAVATDPSGNQAYGDLLKAQVSAKENFDSINATIESAFNRGANPTPLWTALASAYQNVGDNANAEKSLLKALNLNHSYELLMRTGQFYLATQHFDLAAAMFRGAIEAVPDSAAAYYDLGVSNEGAYEYFQAEQAYRTAAHLSPAEYNARFNEFKRRIALAGQMK